MNFHLRKITKRAITIMLMLIGIFATICSKQANAISSGITMAPMNQNIVLSPGNSYNASFIISNPANSSDNINYKLGIEPFYLDNNNAVEFGTDKDSNAIVNWITFISPIEGELTPNETKEINFTINVPEKTPAGGQYAAITVTKKISNSDEEENKSETSHQATIKEVQRVGHLIYAEVTGNTIKNGEILDANVSSFLFNDNIKGTSSIKNTGNVHGIAKYTLRVFPLFSDEEIYTNEEDPAIMIIFPDRTVYNETSWDETPTIGIFNVIYTVEFENATTEIKKLVIKCPIWLLFIIVFAIFALIFYFIAKSKARKKASQKADKN